MPPDEWAEQNIHLWGDTQGKGSISLEMKQEIISHLLQQPKQKKKKRKEGTKERKGL